MNNQWEICKTCNVRHCRVKPVKAKGVLGGTWVCNKYRKHNTGWKLSEIAHEPRRKKEPMVLFEVGSGERK